MQVKPQPSEPAGASPPAPDPLTDLATARQQLQDTQRQLEALRQRQAIDEQLIAHDAIDLEAGRLLATAALERMGSPDVGAAVTALREQRPYLFRPVAAPPRVMGQDSSPASDPDAALHDAAARAQTTGRRRDLLDYLRLRRRA